MKKRLSFLTIILLVALLLVGCGKKTEPSEPTPTPSDTLTKPVAPIIDIDKTEYNILFENKEVYIDIGSTSYEDVTVNPLNRDIFGVRNDGLIIPLGIGTGKVEITHNKNESVKVTVTVTILESISLEVEVLNYTLVEGDTEQLLFETDDPEGVSFNVKDEDIVSVDEAGLITALKEGSTTITVSSILDPSKSFVVEVDVTEDIYINADSFLYVGLNNPLTIEVETNDLLGVEYVSSDEEVFTVNETGLITAVSKGEATLTIKSKLDNTVTKDVEIEVVEQYEKLFNEAVDSTVELSNYTFLVNAQELLGDEVHITEINIKVDNDKTLFEVDRDEIYFIIEDEVQYMIRKIGERYIKEEVQANGAEAFILFELFEVEDFLYFAAEDKYILQNFDPVEPFKDLFGEGNRLASFSVILEDGLISRIEYTLVTDFGSVIVTMEVKDVNETIVEVPTDATH